MNESRRRRPVATKLSELGPETQLWFLAVANFDMRQAHNALNARRLCASRRLGDELMSAWGELAIVRYVRPFLQCNTPTKRKSTCIPDEILAIYDESEHAVHNRIKTLRHETIAHSDMTGVRVSLFAEFEQDEPFQKSMFYVGAHVDQPTPTEEDFLALEGMVIKMADSLSDHLADCQAFPSSFHPLLVGLGLSPQLQPSPED